MKSIRLSLASPPEVVNMGIAVHGRKRAERYRLPELWCVHLYRYHATLEVNGESLEIEPGVATLVPPDTEVMYRFRGRSEHTYVHLRVTEPSADQDRPSIVEVPMRLRPRYFVQAEAALREAVGFWAQSPTRAEARVWDVLWQLTEAEHVQTGRDAVVLLRALIENRLSARLRVAELLGDLKTSYSHNHVLRLFKQETGMTIAGYIRCRRVERGVRLLRYTSLPIKSIAIEVGVADLQAFNKLVRRHTGRSPRGWRSV